MSKTAIQFGAGNIGRGFIAQLFTESGLEVVFVDVIPEIVLALNQRHGYQIEIAGPDSEYVEVSGVRAIDGCDKEAVATAVAECEIACTAVGAAALKYVAPNLAAGLSLRYQQRKGPLNVLICENLHDAADHLKGLLRQNLEPATANEVLAQTGFVQAVVSRMVPLTDKSAHDPLAVKVEAYKRLPVDGSAVVGTLPSVIGVEVVDNFDAYVERKLFTHNCSHAVLGYVGYFRGLRYGFEALEDDVTRRLLNRVLAETSEALARKHGFDRAEQAAHVQDLLERFANRALGDTCFRLAKDPIRKLAPDDRLVGAARLCEAQGIVPKSLSEVIAYALCFDAMEDEAAVRLQTMIRSLGVESVLNQVCTIKSQENLGASIISEYRSLREEQSRR